MFGIYMLIALAAGMALATQAGINTQLAKAMGGQPLTATLVSFSVGALALLLVALVRGDLAAHLHAAARQPLWQFSGGMLGALVVFTTVLLAPKLGVTNMLFFIIIGQLLTASVIDHFGLIYMPVREISAAKIAGLAVMGLGLAVYSFGDRLSDWLR